MDRYHDIVDNIAAATLLEKREKRQRSCIGAQILRASTPDITNIYRRISTIVDSSIEWNQQFREAALFLQCISYILCAKN